MGRRNRIRGERKAPPPPFAEAFQHLEKMEAAVAYRTVTTAFALDDVACWLWPDEITSALKAAWPYSRSQPVNASTGPLRIQIGDDILEFSFLIALEPIRMLPPAEGLVHFNQGRGGPIVSALTELAHVHRQFNLVRRVVAWMNDNATPGAARFYFPGMCALLSNGHPIHEADGLRYKEPAGPMGSINQLIRQAGAIVASGLMCDPEHVVNSFTGLGVQVQADADGLSQRFMLL